MAKPKMEGCSLRSTLLAFDIGTSGLKASLVDEDLNIIIVKGAVPGSKDGIVRVRMAGDGKSW